LSDKSHFYREDVGKLTVIATAEVHDQIMAYHAEGMGSGEMPAVPYPAPIFLFCDQVSPAQGLTLAGDKRFMDRLLEGAEVRDALVGLLRCPRTWTGNAQQLVETFGLVMPAELGQEDDSDGEAPDDGTIKASDITIVEDPFTLHS
jgi:hypothetical protein